MTKTLVALPILTALAGCYASYSGAPTDAPSEADARDDAADDAPRDDTSEVLPETLECLTDDDCVVALPVDRCCSPDPRAVPRSTLEENHCLRELGRPWGDSPLSCMPDCDHCEPMDYRFYAAHCIAGACVGIEDFCPPMVAPTPVADLHADGPDFIPWGDYQGQYIRASGYLQLGPASCACGTGTCPCRDQPVQWTIGCTLALRGSTCGTPWACSGTECDPSCSPTSPGLFSIVEGYVVANEETGPELWITTAPGECAPPGPNPVGERCDAFEEDGIDCAEGLFCYYWGDVVMGCDGECRPPGTECDGEEDCPDGDVCYHGYCEWCCPG